MTLLTTSQGLGNEDPALCPVECLKCYLERTEPYRQSLRTLFLGLNLELSPQSEDALWASDSALKPETHMQAMTDLLQQAGIGHPENAWA